jgi:hypothetical protein
MRLWGTLLLLSIAVTASAHDVPPSVVQFDIGREVVDVELQLPLKELSAALGKDSTLASGLAAEAYVSNHLHLKAPTGVPFATSIESWSLSHTDNRNWVSNDWLVMRLRARPPAGADTERFTLDYDVIVETVVSHKALVYVRRDIRHGLLGETPQTIGLIAFQQTQLTVDGSGGSWWTGFMKLWHLGVEHIAQGTDHLLFLLVLVLPAPLLAGRSRWGEARPVGESVWKIAKTVSGFTIGHSITLALGALGVVAIPERPVEVLIAASIVVCAVHAWRPLFAGKEIYLATGFGLIHGLAFATTLRGFNFDATTLYTSLLGFNLGIECMQLAVIACVMPWLLIASRTRAYEGLRLAGAAIGATAALAWIAERLSGQTNQVATMVAWAAGRPSWLWVSSVLPLSVLGLFVLVGAGSRDETGRPSA